MKTGTIVFEDYKGQSATVKVSKASSLSAVRELAEKLGGYSRAKVVSASFTETYIFDNFQNLDFGDMLSGAASEHYDRVCQKAKLLFQDADSGSHHSLSIPAPNDNVFNAHQEVNSDVAEDLLDLYAAANSMESNDLMYKGGFVVGKKPKMVARTLTGV